MQCTFILANTPLRETGQLLYAFNTLVSHFDNGWSNYHYQSMSKFYTHVYGSQNQFKDYYSLVQDTVAYEQTCLLGSHLAYLLALLSVYTTKIRY